MQEISDEKGIYSIARATDEQLAQCDDEPIHIPEAIQPHGFLLQVDVEDLRIQRASANTAAYIGLAAERLVGQKLSTVLPNPHQLLATLGDLTQRESTSNWARSATHRMHLSSELSIPAFECETHVLLDGSFVLEFEPTLVSSFTHRIDHERCQCLRTIYDTQEAGGSLAEIFRLTASCIRSFTQYDRVMVYQMNSEGHGAVVAESKLDSLESYRGLHFPASDIPKQARELYLRNRVRLLSDLRYRPIPLLSETALEQAPLDMSMCHLRSVSPVHVEYLTNMGVAATLVISIVVDNHLWGLIACHHYAPKHLDSRFRNACEEISRCISSMIRCANAEEERRALVAGVSFQRALEEQLHTPEWLRSIAENEQSLLKQLDVDGMILLSDHEQFNYGICPNQVSFEAIRVNWPASCGSGDSYMRSLSEILLDGMSQIHPLAGCARSVISENPAVELYLFRREESLTVHWGGDPRKPEHDNVRLSPRQSFERWCQNVRGFSVPWSPVDKCRLREFSRFISARRVEDSARDKEKFLANMSHELRTPLTAIIGYADIAGDLMEGSDVSQEVVTSVKTIRRNGQHLLGLINDVLDISKLHSADIQLANKAVQVESLVDHLQDQLGGQLRDKGVELAIHAAGVPSSFVADEGRIEQILTNLISNAVKFTDVGSVSLMLTIDARLEWLRFAVTDTGIGIPADRQGRLFTPFYQAQDGYSRKYGGTGLGLALSRELARSMGGELRLVRSIVGQGSTFELSLPFLATSNDQLEVTTLPSSLATRPDYAGECVKVLLVEDGVDNQRLVSFILKKEGYEVTIVNNGQEALQACCCSAEPEAFDIILMDMQMPIMDGYTATQELRASGWRGPIIALTAHAMPSDRDKCLQIGCNEYVSKPLDRARLVATIHQLLPQESIH